MAGDWIKMRTDLYRHPKVCQMADHLLAEDGELAGYVSSRCMSDMTVTRNVMRNVTVGALVSVWGVTRHRGKRVDDDLVLSGSTLSVVDDISDLPGFGRAMAAVGWAEEAGGSVVFPRFFEELNVEPAADLKAKNAARQKRYRENRNAKRDVTRDVTVTQRSNTEKRERREEESREEVEEGRAPAEPAAPPAELLAVIDCWNEAAPTFGGRVCHRDPPGKKVQSLWRSAWLLPEFRESVADRGKLRQAFLDAKWGHGKTWFDLPGLLGNNDRGEPKLIFLMRGGYRGDSKSRKSIDNTGAAFIPGKVFVDDWG